MKQLPESKKISTLVKMLTIAGHVFTTSRDIVDSVVEYIKKGEGEVVEKRWADSWKNFSDLDLSKDKTWSTYEGCHSLQFFHENESIMLNAVVYEGNMTDGLRTERRFRAKIKLPLRFIVLLDYSVTNGFMCEMETMYEEHQQMLKKKWIAKMKTDLLK